MKPSVKSFRYVAALALLTLAAVLAGCGGAFDSVEGPAPGFALISPGGLVVTTGSTITVPIGAADIVLNVEGDGITIVSATSSNPNVASVTFSGDQLVINPGQPGSANITVVLNTPSGQQTITFVVIVAHDQGHGQGGGGGD